MVNAPPSVGTVLTPVNVVANVREKERMSVDEPEGGVGVEPPNKRNNRNRLLGEYIYTLCAKSASAVLHVFPLMTNE